MRASEEQNENTTYSHFIRAPRAKASLMRAYPMRLDYPPKNRLFQAMIAILSPMSPSVDFKIFSLGANDALAQKIADRLGVPLGKIITGAFSSGEQHIQFLENLRGKVVFLVQ